MWSLRCASALLLLLAIMGWVSAQPSDRGEWLLPAVAVTALAFGVMLAHRHGPASRPGGDAAPHPWLVALVLASARFGCATSSELPTEGSRGPVAAPTWQELELVSAAWPGDVCSFVTTAPRLAIRMDPKWDRCDLRAGDRIRIDRRGLRCAVAAFAPQRPSSLPTCELDRYFLRSRGRGLRAKISAEIVALRQQARRDARGNDARALVMAMSTGIAACLSPQRRDELRRSGLTHLVAVSGLHVGIMMAAALALSLALRRRWPRAGAIVTLLSLTPAFAFVMLAGASPSAVRALCFGVLVVLAAHGGIALHRLSAAIVVASAMALGEPTLLCAPSFQLSFAAVLGILLGHAPSGAQAAADGRDLDPLQVSTRGAHGLVDALRDGWRVSLSATLGTAPIVLWHFGRAPWIGLPANVVAVPIASTIVLPLGVIGLSLRRWGEGWPLLEWLADVMLDLAGVAADLVLAVAALASRCESAGPIAWIGISGALWLALWRIGRPGAAPHRPYLAPLRRLAGGVSIASACVLVASKISGEIDRPERSQGDAELIVLGGAREPTHLVRVDDRTACLAMRSGDPSRVLRMVEGLQLSRLMIPETSDPRAQALYTQLRGILDVEVSPRCPAKLARGQRELVDQAFRECHVLDPRDAVLRVEARGLFCHAHGSWLALDRNLAAASVRADSSDERARPRGDSFDPWSAGELR